jgi:nicotinic acid phosphoribosyltransferase
MLKVTLFLVAAAALVGCVSTSNYHAANRVGATPLAVHEDVLAIHCEGGSRISDPDRCR